VRGCCLRRIGRITRNRCSKCSITTRNWTTWPEPDVSQRGLKRDRLRVSKIAATGLAIRCGTWLIPGTA